jgi:hypothetical protein
MLLPTFSCNTNARVHAHTHTHTHTRTHTRTNVCTHTHTHVHAQGASLPKRKQQQFIAMKILCRVHLSAMLYMQHCRWVASVYSLAA